MICIPFLLCVVLFVVFLYCKRVYNNKGTVSVNFDSNGNDISR